MKLAIVSPVFPPYRSGQGSVVQDNALMAGEAGYETQVFTPWYRSVRSSPREEERNGYVIHRLRPIVSYGNAAIVPQLFWALRRADCIHLHYPALGMELPVLMWALFGKKVVTTYHMDLVGRGWFMRSFFLLYTKFFLPHIVRWSSAIFVSSFDYANASPLLAPYMRTSPERFSELPCSVDTEKWGQIPSVGYRESDPIILFVGALDSAHYSKGVPVLLKAITRVTECSLVIVGNGDLRPAYERAAREHGIADRVRFAGSVGHDELVRWYAQALCLVLPSTDSTEAFGIVLIEAGACGVPAITSNLPGVRSVIEEGVTGFLINPNDSEDCAKKIAWMIAHPDRARAMGAAARRRVRERYAYEVVARKYVRYLREFRIQNYEFRIKT